MSSSASNTLATRCAGCQQTWAGLHMDCVVNISLLPLQLDSSAGAAGPLLSRDSADDLVTATAHPLFPFTRHLRGPSLCSLRTRQ